MKTRTKYEDEKWFRVSYTAVNDMYGEVAKVIYLATDITNERIMELESRKYTDQLKIQDPFYQPGCRKVLEYHSWQYIGERY